jgi:putative tryptophan/tyrosine transport system substrate-binding protein
MRRRDFLSLIGGVAAVSNVQPRGVRAQQAGRTYRIGLLWHGPDGFADAIEVFRVALRELGYVEGRNLQIEYRWAQSKPDLMRNMAEELVRLKVDIIMAPSSIYTDAAKRATSTIPIVFMSHADPLGTGHVASLSQPGGNITGMSLMMTETNVKGLELFKEAVSNLSHLAVIFDPATPSHTPGLTAIQGAGPTLGLKVLPVPVRAATEFDGAFAIIARERADSVLVLSTPLFIAGAEPLAALAVKHKLPSLFGPRHHVEAGGLMSFSPERTDLWRRSATFVDQILKGAKPADLPVQQPVKFDLSINLKTAKAIGVRIPEAFLLRADKVIE